MLEAAHVANETFRKGTRFGIPVRIMRRSYDLERAEGIEPSS
jgi:hypothetical protein